MYQCTTNNLPWSDRRMPDFDCSANLGPRVMGIKVHISGDKKILYHRNPIKEKMQAFEQMVGCFVEQTN